MVLIYTLHRAVPLNSGQQERGTVALADFKSQVTWLRRLGVTFVKMAEVADWLNDAGSLPRLAAVLTIDDGYACVYEHIFPFLQTHNIPFTVFAVPGFIGGQSHLYAAKGLRPLWHMNAEQLQKLSSSGLVEFGANGFHHLNLTSISDEDLRQETRGAKDNLEELLDTEIRYYAYPFGSISDKAVTAVHSSGYELALTTRKARLLPGKNDKMRLPRINWSRKSNLFKLYRHFFLPAS